MALYESDITRFLRELKDQKPHLEDGQAAGRMLLWDKQPIKLDELEQSRAMKVPQKPYVYQTD